MKLDSAGPRGEVWIILRCPDAESQYEAGPVTAVIRKALADRIPADSDVDITLRFRRRRGPALPPAVRMVNARQEFGWVDVVVAVQDSPIYVHAHPVQDLFAPTLTEIADALEEGHSQWSFEISHPDDGTPVTFRSAAPAKAVADAKPRPLTVRRLDPAHPAQDADTGEHEHDAVTADEPKLGSIVLVIDIAAAGHLLPEHLGAVRPAPPVEHSMEVDPDRARGVAFKLRKEVEPELPLFDLEQHGMDAAELDRVNVLLPGDVLEMLRCTLPLSGHVEEGGFLLGQAFSAATPDRQHVVKINQVLSAEHSGASWVHFTFTGDSFQALSRTLAAQEGDRLVGWWHTHPRGVGVGIGLSPTDVKLHRTTFRQPWQVAGLINLRLKGRKVRFYYSRTDSLGECPIWIADERDGYRRASSDLGDC